MSIAYAGAAGATAALAPPLACLKAGLTSTALVPVTTIGVTIGVSVDAWAAAGLGLDARIALVLSKDSALDAVPCR